MAQKKTIKSATYAMAGAQLATVACRFARNVILARLLVPADFGVGATFAITLSFLEMATELGPRKQLVQAKRGGSSTWQGNAQLLLLIRGMLLAVALFLLAPVAAAYFNVAGATAAFRWLALVPLIRGIIHCDVYRYQREFQLGRLATYQAVPTIVSMASAPLFAKAMGDYRAFLAVILLEASLGTVLSHLLATRAYRLRFNASIVRRFVGFGWPLIGNGLLLFSIMHGDRFLIASYFDLDVLGAFSVVFTLALAPTLALASVHGSIALPLFSRSRGAPELLPEYCSRSAQMMCLLAGLLATLFVTAGPWLVSTIYGSRYMLAANAIPWIGLMCAVRLARTTPSMAAVSLGKTNIPLLSNLARAVSFAVAWILASGGHGLVTIPICGFVGEVAAYSISVFLLGRRCSLPPRNFYRSFLGVSLFVAAAWFATRSNFPIPGVAPPLAAGFWLFLLITYCALSWPTLRNMAFHMLRAS